MAAYVSASLALDDKQQELLLDKAIARAKERKRAVSISALITEIVQQWLEEEAQKQTKK